MPPGAPLVPVGLDCMETYHQFAWQGYSCDIPADWNLSEYKIAGGVACARFHDDCNLRLEFEWLQAPRRINPETVRQRYAKIATDMRVSGARAENTEDMPTGWVACFYTMPDGKRMQAAFTLVPQSNFFFLLKIHFEQASQREAGRIVRRIAGTFHLHAQGLVPWAVYDVAFQLHHAFKLRATSFQAGRKLLVFEWRLRRLHLMFFSLADLLCKDQSLETWCAGYLNTFKGISGAKFAGGHKGELVATHCWWRLFGNVEPLLCGCLRYKAWCRLLPDKNQVFIGVFNYRGRADLDFLAGGMDKVLAPPGG